MVTAAVSDLWPAATVNPMKVRVFSSLQYTPTALKSTEKL